MSTGFVVDFLSFNNTSNSICKRRSGTRCWEVTAGSFHQLLNDIHGDTSFKHHSLPPGLKITLDYTELSSVQQVYSFLCSCSLLVVTCIVSASNFRTSFLKASPLLVSPRGQLFPTSPTVSRHLGAKLTCTSNLGLV